ncbi:MAG: hypothetical protein QG654_404 [Patescibacteria group bacterium]|nr:hypothetical protein [Patescibacteria group bacterium]
MTKTLLFFFLLCVASFAQSQTLLLDHDGQGWVMHPSCVQAPAAPAITPKCLTYVQRENERGLQSVTIPQYAVDETVGDFYLQPRLVGEKSSRTIPVYVDKLVDGWKFKSTAMFTIEKDKLHFAGIEVYSLEVYKAPTVPTSD